MGYEGIPRQKLSISKKNKEWGEACVEAYINLSGNGYTLSSRKDDLQKLYDMYNGVVDTGDYNLVLKPYGKSRKNFPSALRNYPIIKPIIDLLLGEKTKRPFNFTVSVQNADTVTRKEMAKQETLYRNLQQRFVNAANKAGVETGIDTQEVPMPEHVANLFESSYVDNRAVMGQHAMSYIEHHQEVKRKLDKAWFHYLVSGECYTHRGVRHNEPFYDILNPLNVNYDLDPDLEFVEDGDWASVTKFVHASTLVDHYFDVLTDSEMLELESPTHSGSDIGFLASMNSKGANTQDSRLIEVVIVYWKSRKRIGFLSFTDPETGEPVEEDVEDGFKMPKELKEIGAKLEWIWVNEVWEGTRIDNKFYVNINPIKNQRTSMENPSLCKLPINGRRYSDVNSENISLVSLGIPFQVNYNIYKYRLELAIARSKDIVAQFDINMIPKKWDMDKFMYFVEGTGIAWVDYNKEGVQLSPQHQSVLDMSIKTIEQYIMLLNSIVEEWEKLSGVTRQRQGQIGSYEGKAASQQAIVQSSHITEDLFKKFAGVEQRDMQALLDYSKEAWHGGKKSAYMMPDGVTEFLDIDSIEHMESNYGIFMTDAGKEKDKIDGIRQLSQAMVQNGVKVSAIAEMMDADSFPQIKAKIKQAEKKQEELEKAQQEAEQQQQQAQLEQQKEQMAQMAADAEKDRETKIKIAEIHVSGQKEGAQLNMQHGLQELELKEEELDIKEKLANEEIRSNKADEAIDREKIKADIKQTRISKTDSNKKKD